MAPKIYVLLVEHDTKDHDKTMNMLQYYSYEVTSVKLASTALSILSKGKSQFDILMANVNSPDSYGFQLLQDAAKRDLLVILMSNDDDSVTFARALEQGAFLCIKKPVTMQILGFLWQHVLREKANRLKEYERYRETIEYNNMHKEFGEGIIEGNQNGNNNAEGKHKSKKNVNSRISQNENVVSKKKVWIEWTEELHEKFMVAVTQLGEGRCYPKEILELMNEPRLTRMQVASHLQKCRNANWLRHSERKSKPTNLETTPPKNKVQRTKTDRFGSMPYAENGSQLFDLTSQKYHQEFSNDPPTETDMLGNKDNGSFGEEYHPQLFLDHINYPFAQVNETFNMGQFGQTFGMEEPFKYGAQNIIIPSNEREMADDTFEFANMDSMVQNFSALRQEFEMDYNGSLHQSLVLDQVDLNQMHIVANNETIQWSQEVPKSANGEEIER